MTYSAAIVLMVSVFALDHAVGRDINLWILYLAPIALVSFVIGLRPGLLCAAFAVCLLLVNGAVLGNPFGSTTAFLLDRLSEAVAYALVVWLIGAVRMAIGGSPPPGEWE